MNQTGAYHTLEKFNLYYRNLSDKGKLRFQERLEKLAGEIEIRGIDFRPSREMETILYSYFVQMSFGFSNFTIGDFDKIHVFENGFINKHTGKELEGKTFNSRIIAISWHHFSESHLLPNDGENIGYYHIGQAIVQSMLNGKSTDDIFCSYFDLAANEVLIDLQRHPKHPLSIQHKRSIQKEDFVALFPYLMEWFFEKSLEFRNDLPQSYAHLCVLMNQDPLAFDKDYAFEKSKYQNTKGVKGIPDKIRKSFAYYKDHWIYSIPLVCVIFLPGFYLQFVRPYILLETNTIIGIWAISGAILFLATKGFFMGSKLFQNTWLFLGFTFTGMAPALLFSGFFLGRFITLDSNISSHRVAEVQTIIGYYKRSSYIKYYEVYFEDAFLSNIEANRQFVPKYDVYQAIEPGDFAIYETGRSIFGFEVIKHKYILPIPKSLKLYP